MQEVADIVCETLDSGKRSPPSSHPWCLGGGGGLKGDSLQRDIFLSSGPKRNTKLKRRAEAKYRRRDLSGVALCISKIQII